MDIARIHGDGQPVHLQNPEAGGGVLQAGLARLTVLRPVPELHANVQLSAVQVST